MERAGFIETLPSPFANMSSFDSDGMVFSPQTMQNDYGADAQRPCTRGQSGSAAMVSYVNLDRGMLPSGSDSSSGVASGAETVSVSAPHGKEKKKVGRPITYKGDINSKDLTEAERRRIKRRVANRESARRVRQKRQETMEEMQARMDAMQRQMAALTARLQEVQQHKVMLVSQLTSMRDKWSVAVSENARLQDEVTRAPGSSPHQSTSARSSGTDVDLTMPPMPVLQPMSPPTLPPAPASSCMPPASSYGFSAAANVGAVTSGQPSDLRVPNVTSSTQISGFRPGVTITSAVCYATGQPPQQQQAQLQQKSVPPPPPPAFATSAAPAAAPTSTQAPDPANVSLAPSAGSMYLQVPQMAAPPASIEMHKAEVPQMQPTQLDGSSLKDAPSMDWEWFLRQSNMEPLLDDSRAY